MLSDVAGDPPPHNLELAQLTADGAGRWNGSVIVCNDLNMLVKSAKGKKGAFPTGISGRYWAFNGEGQDYVEAFLNECRRHAIDWGPDASLSDVAKQLSDSLVDIGKTMGGEMSNPANYNHTTVIRKAILAHYTVHIDRTDWADVDIKTLRAWCPDKKDNLDAFDDSESVSAISDLILHRPDHGMLLSMWACLWGVLVKRKGNKFVLDMFPGNKLQELVADYRRQHGIAPHPQVLVSSMQPKKRKVRPAAS